LWSRGNCGREGKVARGARRRGAGERGRESGGGKEVMETRGVRRGGGGGGKEYRGRRVGGALGVRKGGNSEACSGDEKGRVVVKGGGEGG